VLKHWHYKVGEVKSNLLKGACVTGKISKRQSSLWHLTIYLMARRSVYANIIGRLPL